MGQKELVVVSDSKKGKRNCRIQFTQRAQRGTLFEAHVETMEGAALMLKEAQNFAPLRRQG